MARAKLLALSMARAKLLALSMARAKLLALSMARATSLALSVARAKSPVEPGTATGRALRPQAGGIPPGLDCWSDQ
jgi:hypothetical protein